MPLRAIVNNRVVSVFDYNDGQLRRLQDDIKVGISNAACLECYGDMRVRCIDSENKIAHFFHVVGDRELCPTSDRDYFTHELFKESLKLHLREADYFNVLEIETESREAVAGGNKNWRQIDVKATNWDGTATAHEVQLSYQSVNDIQKRTSDYKRMGYNCIWWLGEAFNTSVCSALSSLDIKWGRAIRVDQHSVSFDYVPIGDVFPTAYGGTGKIKLREGKIYQSDSAAWWKLVNGVLVEVQKP